jgi:hypothetical protein
MMSKIHAAVHPYNCITSPASNALPVPEPLLQQSLTVEAGLGWCSVMCYSLFLAPCYCRLPRTSHLQVWATSHLWMQHQQRNLQDTTSSSHLRQQANKRECTCITPGQQRQQQQGHVAVLSAAAISTQLPSSNHQRVHHTTAISSTNS